MSYLGVKSNYLKIVRPEEGVKVAESISNEVHFDSFLRFTAQH